MGGKPRKKAEAKDPAFAELKIMAEELSGCVVWALKFLNTKSGTGLMYNIRTGHARPWQDDFMDALDKIGYVIDREKYYAERAKKTRRKR